MVRENTVDAPSAVPPRAHTRERAATLAHHPLTEERGCAHESLLLRESGRPEAPRDSGEGGLGAPPPGDPVASLSL